MWDLIVSVPDHCLSFYFVIILIFESLECCSLPTASLNKSVDGRHTTCSGRAFHWTIASG